MSLLDMIHDGEIAPGDVVAWHDYYDDHITKLGLVLVIRSRQALILWADGIVEDYSANNMSVLFGSTIRVRQMIPAARQSVATLAHVL